MARSDLWTVANQLVWKHGRHAPDCAATKAEELLARGERSNAITMRLLADACETLLSELPTVERKVG